MKATLPTEYTPNGKAYDKLITCWRHLVVRRKDGQLDELACLLVHHTASRSANYASFWFFGDKAGKPHAAGHGSATGYGYHRVSAAAAEAIRSAGIKLDEDIGGRGDTAISAALYAIGHACGFADKDMLIVGR